MKKEVKKCPLSIVEWVNYLTLEQNRARYDYYNNEISILTIMILLLTTLNCLLVFGSTLFNLSIINADAKNIVIIVTWVVLVILIIIIAYLVLKILPKYKSKMNDILNEEANILQDILWGKETDPQKILERYDGIWNKKIEK